MKQILKLSLVVIILCTFIKIVIAYCGDHVPFYLNNKGDYVEKVDRNDNTTDITVNAILFNNYDAKLGLSLLKKGITGYSFISRCTNDINGKSITKCTWNNEKKGLHKGVVVLDSKANNVGTIEGYMYISWK